MPGPQPALFSREIKTMPCNYKEYVSNWKEISKYIREVRSGGKCEKCGVQNYEIGLRGKDGTWYSLQQIEDDLNDSGYDYFEKELSHHIHQKGDKLGLLKKDFTKIILTVSHYDHDKKNNLYTKNPAEVWALSKNNLHGLCQRCHLLHDMDRHVANRKRNRELKYQEKQMVMNF
jgi:hypothetical protein